MNAIAATPADGAGTNTHAPVLQYSAVRGFGYMVWA